MSVCCRPYNVFSVEGASVRGSVILTVYGGGEDDETTATDVLTDVLTYLSREYGRDMSYAVLERAAEHFEYETWGQA